MTDENTCSLYMIFFFCGKYGGYVDTKSSPRDNLCLGTQMQTWTVVRGSRIYNMIRGAVQKRTYILSRYVR